MQSFDTRLARAMKKRKVTGTALALALGVDPSAVSKWVNGRQLPRLERMTAIAKVCGTTISYLLGRK